MTILNLPPIAKKIALMLASLVVLALILIAIGNRIGAINAWDAGYRINSTDSNVSVTVGSISGTCYTVTNNSALDYFVPTKTQTEWDSFFAHLPVSVTATTCCTNDCSPQGSTQCSGSNAQTCGNYDADSCLEWGGDSFCAYGCSGGVCQDCTVSNTQYTFSCYNNDLYWYDNCGGRQSLLTDCTAYTAYESAGDGWCNPQEQYCTTGGLFPDAYMRHVIERTYSGNCSGSSCSYTDGATTEQQVQCTYSQHVFQTPVGCGCASGVPSC